MSLRAVPARLFSIVCDTCGVETAGQTMPVAAEVRAAAGVRRRVARAALAEGER